MKDIVTFLFGLGFLFNASLFIPQAIRIWQTKKAKDVSIITFIGFNLIQLNSIFYGYYQNDLLLVYGNLISFICCGVVTCLAMFYRYR